MMRRFAVVVAGLALSTAGIAQPNAPAARATEVMRIDGAANDFSTLGFVIVRNDGVIVVSEPSDHRLRFFDSAGKQVAVFGRRGQGPGEFAARNGTPAEADLRAGTWGDTVWVYDDNLRRFTVISPDFTLVRTVRQPPNLPGIAGSGRLPNASATRTLLSVNPLVYFPDGRVFGRAGYGTIESVRRPDGSSAPMMRRTDTKYIAATAAGELTG